ncbi:hypothetical protein C0J52_17492, partial [Blattella germanica]
EEWDLWQHLKEGLKILHKTKNNSQYKHVAVNYAAQNSSNCTDERCSYRFVLLDWFEELINVSSRQSYSDNFGDSLANNVVVVGRWRPLLQMEENVKSTNSTVSVKQAGNKKIKNRTRLSLVPLLPFLKDWARIKEEGVTCEFDDENCIDSEAMGSSELIMRGAHIAAIVICSALCAAILVIAGAVARKQLLKKRMSKGPYKILLTPSDFVFPHVPDTLRVDEGIEAMLCSWLQQLQEFGGPEVDKPDLLKGSIGSLRSHPQAKSAGSSSSLARNLLVDPKARYNVSLINL